MKKHSQRFYLHDIRGKHKFTLYHLNIERIWCYIIIYNNVSLKKNLFLFLAVLGLSFCARAFSSCGEWGHPSSQCAVFSLSWPLLLRSTGSRHAGSVVVAHGPSYSAACGIFPDQGSNPCPLHWQADSQPLRHQGSPTIFHLYFSFLSFDII